MAKDKLTPKQERFIDEYMANGFNGTEAAYQAGYCKDQARDKAYNVLHSIATENLQKPAIAANLAVKKAELAHKCSLKAQDVLDSTF